MNKKNKSARAIPSELRLKLSVCEERDLLG